MQNAHGIAYMANGSVTHWQLQKCVEVFDCARLVLLAGERKLAQTLHDTQVMLLHPLLFEG